MELLILRMHVPLPRLHIPLNFWEKMKNIFWIYIFCIIYVYIYIYIYISIWAAAPQNVSLTYSAVICQVIYNNSNGACE